MRAAGWLPELWDRVVASDPGLGRLRMAASSAVGVASTLLVEYLFATLTHAGPQGTLIAMLLGAVVAMMGSMALTDTAVWPKVRTAIFFPVAVGVGMAVGVAVASHANLMLGVFVVVMFAAVFVRRFGPAFFFYGFMTWMGYFFASFLHATMPMLPALLAAVVVSSAWVLLLSITVLRTNPHRTLRRTVRAFDARARAVARAGADLLDHAATDEPSDRLRRRLRRRQSRLAEVSLMVEAWSAVVATLPADWSAHALRRHLIDLQQTVDAMAAASEGLAGQDVRLSVIAVSVLDALARRDDVLANRAAYELAEAAEGQAGRTGWWPGRHLAVAALGFVSLSRKVRSESSFAEPAEFEPAVTLAMGNLPGSPAAAKDVPARGSRWNPLARLDMPTRQAVQVAIAGALAIVAGREVSETRYYWAVIAAFVMFTGTGTRAETFIKGFNRVLGTLVGLVASIWLADLTAGHTDGVLVVIVASIFCGFYLISVSYAYMIFFITIMVGQLYSVLHEFSDGFLLLRLEETAIGATVGFAVAMVVVPLSTRDTVRSVRDNVLNSLADLLDGIAGRLAGLPTAASAVALDGLARGLDDRVRQLALVARPLTRPLLWGNSPPRTRHRLGLYAATATHARELTVAVRTPGRSAGSADASRALAEAARQLTEARPGRLQPAAARPLAEADTVLFARCGTVPGGRATDPVLAPLIRLHDLLRELAEPGRPMQPQAEPREVEAEVAAAGVVSGTVTDEHGHPVDGGMVLLLDGAGHRLARQPIDTLGHYRIETGHGLHVAVVSAPGYQPKALRIDVRPGRLSHTAVTLATLAAPARSA